MLKYGLDLTYPVDEFNCTEGFIHLIGMLMICLDNEITTEVKLKYLAKELSPESSRVVFKDNGFKTDSNKTNIKEILKPAELKNLYI